MDNLKLLLDKTYITNILCDLSYNYYNFINNCIMLPTILGSSILTIMNSSEIDVSKMKIINITLNGLNTLILAISTNYKLNDRINNYKSNRTKIIKLQHLIESYMLKNDTITSAKWGEHIRHIEIMIAYCAYCSYYLAYFAYWAYQTIYLL